jgi:hypothetical protein
MSLDGASHRVSDQTTASKAASESLKQIMNEHYMFHMCSATINFTSTRGALSVMSDASATSW